MSTTKLTLDEFLRRRAAERAVDKVLARQLKGRIAKRLNRQTTERFTRNERKQNE